MCVVFVHKTTPKLTMNLTAERTSGNATKRRGKMKRRKREMTGLMVFMMMGYFFLMFY